MSKVTAVEWLIDEIRNQIKVHGKLSAITLSKLKMQAKAMEKMQIIEAYEQGEIEWSPFDFKTAQDYYTNTFK